MPNLMALARAGESWAWNSNDSVYQMRWLRWTSVRSKTPPVLHGAMSSLGQNNRPKDLDHFRSLPLC